MNREDWAVYHRRGGFYKTQAALDERWDAAFYGGSAPSRHPRCPTAPSAVATWDVSAAGLAPILLTCPLAMRAFALGVARAQRCIGLWCRRHAAAYLA